MKQLQTRINPFIGGPEQPWVVDDEATVVTKSMKSELKRSQSHAGERSYRIVDTRKNPELVSTSPGPSWPYRPAAVI